MSKAPTNPAARDAGQVGSAPKVVVIAGASGLVGTALAERLRRERVRVLTLVRRAAAGPDEVSWSPAAGQLDAAALEGVDALVNLSGENVAGGRWSARRKAAIRDSRLNVTNLLSDTVLRLRLPPRVIVCASAIGYYGDRGDEIVCEDDPPGVGFLPELCAQWEQAAQRAGASGARVVCLRIGLALSAKGGALAKMLPAFRLGLGGVLGSGRQWMSWIGLDDLVEAAVFAIRHDRLKGPVNAVSPNPVTNRAFTRTLATVLSRPAVLPAPSLLIRAALGEMGARLLLEGQRVMPQRLLDSGFQFRTARLDEALRQVLQR